MDKITPTDGSGAVRPSPLPAGPGQGVAGEDAHTHSHYTAHLVLPPQTQAGPGQASGSQPGSAWGRLQNLRTDTTVQGRAGPGGAESGPADCVGSCVRRGQGPPESVGVLSRGPGDAPRPAADSHGQIPASAEVPRPHGQSRSVSSECKENPIFFSALVVICFIMRWIN